MTTQQVRGFTAQVTLDSSSSATIPHGVGKVPTSVTVQCGGPGQLVSVAPSSYTDTNFRAKFTWHDGATWPAGTKIWIAVSVAYEVDEPAPESPGKRCELPVFETSELRKGWTSPANSNVRVLNEVWNAAEAGPQTLYVCNESSWRVRANHPKPGAREGSIKSYPCTQVLLPQVPLTSIEQMTSRWAHEAPALGEWNATYDIWFGNFSREVMLWMDHRYLASIPPANIPAADRAGFTASDGTQYTAWRRGNSKPGGIYIALVREEKASSGEVDLRDIFDWLLFKGWLVPTDKLDAVDYGIEIASTEQTDQDFWLTDFELSYSFD